MPLVRYIVSLYVSEARACEGVNLSTRQPGRTGQVLVNLTGYKLHNLA